MTDPNNLMTTWQYDNVGRLKRQQLPDGAATDLTRDACTSTGSCGPNDLRSTIKIIARDINNAAIRDDTLFFDAFDRLRVESRQLTTMPTTMSVALIVRFGTLARVPKILPTSSDNGLAFTRRSYTAMVRSHGLRQEFITPPTPEQKGRVERVIRTLKEQCLRTNDSKGTAGVN